MVVNKRLFTFQQDGAPAHTSKHAQDWCLQNLPNFINKDDWLANSPDLMPMENLFSILNEKVYCDREPQTLDELKNRIIKAWREITIDCLKSLLHSMPKRLESVIDKNGGHCGYKVKNKEMSLKRMYK